MVNEEEENKKEVKNNEKRNEMKEKEREQDTIIPNATKLRWKLEWGTKAKQPTTAEQIEWIYQYDAIHNFVETAPKYVHCVLH